MANLISDEQRNVYQAAFKDIHDTFSRKAIVYKTPKRIVLSTTPDYNFMYTDAQEALDVQYIPVSGEINVRVKWLNPAELKGIKDIKEKAESAVKKGIDKMEDGIKDIKEKAEAAVKKGIEKMEKGIEILEEKTKEMVIGKIKSIFSQLGGIFDDAIIDPIKKLIYGFGTVFKELFNILKMIGNKITSLPGCMPFYFFFGIFDTISGVFKSFLPNFITKPIEQLYNFLIEPIFNFMLKLIGYNNSKCYGFDVSKSIDKIDDTFKDIGKEFTSNFGRLRFNTIQV
jgi:hypothetical protein